MKKKSLLIATTVTVLSLFLLVGCTQSADIPNAPTPTPVSTETPSITDVPSMTESTDSFPTKALTPTVPSEPIAVLTPTEIPIATPTPSPTEIPTATPTPTPTEIPHVHEYVDSVSVPAGCETDGETLFTCICNDSYTEPIPATGHNYVADDSTKTAPTCTKDGKEVDQVCTNCSNILTGATIPATGHSYGDYIYNNDATQKADGTKTRTCKVCGKTDTKTATGTKLPFDPYSLRAITSLDEIESVGTMTDEDSSIHYQTRLNIEAGKYEKVRYISSTGDQFCLWDVRITDTRDGNLFYYWFAAPVEDKFSNGYMHSNLFGSKASDVDRSLTTIGPRISGSMNECMIDRDESIPLGERTINTTECPVDLYKIVETDDMISVWVESTNCIQEGIGTCGTINCTGTCLRSTTLNTLRSLPAQKGWKNYTASGENGRIYWNGKLLVNFYTLNYE